MSSAFVKERDGDTFEPLPDRRVSPHPNLVTAEGLAQIEANLQAVRQRQANAQNKDDRPALAQLEREARYWTQRRASAQIIGGPERSDEVAFGSTVTIERDDGRRQTYRIVGEDEADPAQGRLSYVSPVARALMGCKVGDVVRAGKSDAEVIQIS
jgi:transcription elongation GreA/GreB family factor